MVNGFHRGGETIRHLWGAELTSGPSDAEQDHLSVGTLEPLWNLLTSRGRSARPTGTSRSATHRPSRSALTAATSAADDRTSAAGRNGSQPASAVRVIASVSPRAPNAVPPDEQQLYGGTQSALSTTLLLWRSSAGADGAPIVEGQHCHRVLLLVGQSRGLERSDRGVSLTCQGRRAVAVAFRRQVEWAAAGRADGSFSGLRVGDW
jgi:hypothetical protein